MSERDADVHQSQRGNREHSALRVKAHEPWTLRSRRPCPASITAKTSGHRRRIVRTICASKNEAGASMAEEASALPWLSSRRARLLQAIWRIS